jgi:hypothetical protein
MFLYYIGVIVVALFQELESIVSSDAMNASEKEQKINQIIAGIKSNPEVFSQSPENLLSLAVHQGKKELIRYLLKAGITLNNDHSNNNRFLGIALGLYDPDYNFDPEIIKLLLDAGADPNLLSLSDSHLMNRWIQSGAINSESCINVILASGKINLEQERTIWFEHGPYKSYYIQTFLDFAIERAELLNKSEDYLRRKNSLNKVRILLSHGAIIKEPIRLFSLLRNWTDQEDCNLFTCLNHLWEGLITPGDKEISQQRFEEIKEYVDNVYNPRNRLIKNTLQLQTSAQFPSVLCDIISEYEELPRQSLGFFKPEEIKPALAEQKVPEKSRHCSLM